MSSTSPRPSLQMLRCLTHEHVLEALMAEPLLTRAEIAARTGISKPTIGESVRALVGAGILRDSGRRTSGRGRVGTYYALADDLGVGLAIDIAPGGVTVEAVDLHGKVAARELARISRPADPGQVAIALRSAVERAVPLCPGPVRLAVISAADPVDRSSGRLVQLPDAPFLVGGLSPVEVLKHLVAGSIVVDNDVNWAARAELGASGQTGSEDFAYLYLGEGVGCAIVADGEVRRGANGIAGEIAHLITCGPNGKAIPFSECFAKLGLRRHGSTAIDVTALLSRAEAGDQDGQRLLGALAQAVAGVIAAVIALSDPAEVVIGGVWGAHPVVMEAISAFMAGRPRTAPLRAPSVATEPSLAGARAEALTQLRHLVQHQRLLR